MKQKKIWMTYLTIGISLMILGSCVKADIGYGLFLNHNYVNPVSYYTSPSPRDLSTSRMPSSA